MKNRIVSLWRRLRAGDAPAPFDMRVAGGWFRPRVLHFEFPEKAGEKGRRYLSVNAGRGHDLQVVVSNYSYPKESEPGVTVSIRTLELLVGGRAYPLASSSDFGVIERAYDQVVDVLASRPSKAGRWVGGSIAALVVAVMILPAPKASQPGLQIPAGVQIPGANAPALPLEQMAAHGNFGPGGRDALGRELRAQRGRRPGGRVEHLRPHQPRDRQVPLGRRQTVIASMPMGAFKGAWVAGLMPQMAVRGEHWDRATTAASLSGVIRDRLALLDGPLAPLWHSRVSELVNAVLPAIELSCHDRAEPFTVRAFLQIAMSADRMEQLAFWIRREKADHEDLALPIEAYLARLPGYRVDPLVRSEEAMHTEHAYIASKLPQLLEG